MTATVAYLASLLILGYFWSQDHKAQRKDNTRLRTMFASAEADGCEDCEILRPACDRAITERDAAHHVIAGLRDDLAETVRLCGVHIEAVERGYLMPTLDGTRETLLEDWPVGHVLKFDEIEVNPYATPIAAQAMVGMASVVPIRGRKS